MNNARAVTEQLFLLYPDAECGLNSGGDPFRLLIMAILSAQCTDKRVNEVAKTLFLRFPTPLSIAESKEGELENEIRSVGLYNSKAKNIRNCCRTLCDRYGSEVPSGMDELLSLGGVGRKVANLVRGDLFGLGGIVADTHLIRISNRLGLVESNNPVVVERTLQPLVPNELQSGFCHRVVMFGREFCRAVNPHCESCPLAAQGLCRYHERTII